MARAIERDQQVTVAHRENFIGRPAGPQTVAWDYKPGRTYPVRRPDDGEPLRHWRIACPSCGTQLDFKVRSVRATHRRQVFWRACAWIGLVVLVVGLIGPFALDNEALALLILVGFPLAYFSAGLASDEMGLSGHNAGMPIVAKHAVSLIESPPEDHQELICEKCGHEETFPHGSDFRKSYVEKQYQAAKSRLEAHHCEG